jgi:hypothetical protein
MAFAGGPMGMGQPGLAAAPGPGSGPAYEAWLSKQKEKKKLIDEELEKGLDASRTSRKEKAAKAPPAESRLQTTFRDFRHGIIHFEGVGMSARFMLPPPNLEDPSLILKAMFERTFWNLDPPAVIFGCDELLFAGGGPGGGYFLQDDGAQARPVQWEWNWPDWQKVLGGRSQDNEDVASAVPRHHMLRMQTLARACHQTASEHDLCPWFFSGEPCLGGGKGGKMFADYCERASGAGVRPIFVGAPSPAQGLFDEEGGHALEDSAAMAPSPLENMGSSQPPPHREGSRKQPDLLGLSSSTASSQLLPFFLRGMPDVDLQAFAVKMNETPNRRVSYPDEKRNLLGDKDSNRRFMNPGVTHYIFFRRQQEALHQKFVQLVECTLAASVRLVAGPCLNPAYAKDIYDEARRRRGSMLVILDKSAPLATRMAAGIRNRRDGSSPPPQEDRSSFGFRGFFGGNMSGPYDLSPIEVPREVDSQTLATCEIVPFLEEPSEEGFYHKVSDLLGRKLPKLASVQNRASDTPGVMMQVGHMDRLHFFWEVATRLCKTADSRSFRRKLLSYIAVIILVVAFQYAIFFGYDEPELEYDASFERPCFRRLSPVHWLGSVWFRVCPYQSIIRYVHAFLPAFSVALLMKLNMPLTLAYDEHGRWLRSAGADIVREVYRYRTGVGVYRPVAHKWSKSSASPTHGGETTYTPRSPHIIFEERSEVIQARVLTNTGIEVDSLAKPTNQEILNFKSDMLTTPENPAPTPEKQTGTYTRVGDGESDTSRQSTRSLIASIDDGKSHMSAEEYVHFRLIGSRERFQEKRARQKCRYELWWVLIIVMTISASAFSLMRMNLSMLLCMVILTAIMVVVDLDRMPLRLKQTGAAIQVLGEYLAAWERLSPRERKTHAKLHALVDGVEDIILKEDPFYLSDYMAIHTGSVSPKPSPEPANVNPLQGLGDSMHRSPRWPTSYAPHRGPGDTMSLPLTGIETNFQMGGQMSAPMPFAGFAPR